MRPLAIESVSSAPPFVRGISIVRGKPTPIVDLRTLLGDPDGDEPRRLVTLRLAGDRPVGVLVDEVLGVLHAGDLEPAGLPPLLQTAAGEVIEELARLDGEILTVLQSSALLPDELYERVLAREDLS